MIRLKNIWTIMDEIREQAPPVDVVKEDEVHTAEELEILDRWLQGLSPPRRSD